MKPKATIRSEQGELFDIFIYNGIMLDEKGNIAYDNRKYGSFIIGFTKHTNNQEAPRVIGTSYFYETLFKKKNNYGFCLYHEPYTGTATFDHDTLAKLKQILPTLKVYTSYTPEAWERRGRKH